MTSMYDSIIKDDLSNSAIDFNEINFKKFKLQSQSQQKSSLELSAGGGQNTIMATKTISVYDSINL